MEPVKYIDRTRDYYRAQGYEKDYAWAHFDEIPFSAMSKALADCRIALVSTSDIAVRGAEDDGDERGFLIGNAYSIPADTAVDQLHTEIEHFDRHATHLDDVNSYFPITRLHEAARAGRIASVAQRAHGVFTSYSQRRTSDVDAAEVLKRCREDAVDAVLLTPV